MKFKGISIICAVLALLVGGIMVGTGVNAAYDTYSGTVTMNVVQGPVTVTGVTNKGTITATGWILGNVEIGKVYTATFTVHNGLSQSIGVLPSLGTLPQGISATWFPSQQTYISSGGAETYTLQVVIGQGVTMGSNSIQYYLGY